MILVMDSEFILQSRDILSERHRGITILHQGHVVSALLTTRPAAVHGKPDAESAERVCIAAGVPGACRRIS